MKQYDSYLIFGCHFPRKAIEIIESNSSIRFFNKKIKELYNCEIIEAIVPINEKYNIKNYFLKIIVEQSDDSILKVEKIKDIDSSKFLELLDVFELDRIEPYLISVPFIRDLPNYIQ